MRRWPPCSPPSSTLRPAPPGQRAGSPSATRSPRLLRGAEADEVEIAVACLSRRDATGPDRRRLGDAGGAARHAARSRADADAARGRRRARRRRRTPAARARRPRAARAAPPCSQRATAAEQDFLRAPARRRAAPGRARGRDARRDRRRRRRAGAPTCAARRCSPATCARSRASALAEGAARASRASPSPLHRPVQPMLAQPADDIAGALARLGTAALEWKLDGARVQVHKAGDEVRVYTRSAERRDRVGAGDRRGAAGAAGARADPRRRGDRARRRRRAAAVPGDDAPLRPQARRRAHARRAAAGGATSSTACTSTATSLHRPAGARALRRARRGAADRRS